MARTLEQQVAEHRLDDVVGELADAFTRLLGDDPVKRDPGCRGKLAIVRALHALDHWDDRVFVAGRAGGAAAVRSPRPGR
jgi:hypothetical protein